MAENIDDLALPFKCTDGILYGNRRFYEVHSNTIKSSEESTGEKAKFIDIPFRKLELRTIFDIIDNRYADIDQQRKEINYQEFLKVVDWLDMDHFGTYCIDSMFFSDEEFYAKCKQCYEEITQTKSDYKDFYNKLPEIFKSLGYN